MSTWKIEADTVEIGMDPRVAYPKLGKSVFLPHEPGSWVSVRLAGAEDEKTYLGIYLGDVGRVSGKYADETKQHIGVFRSDVGDPMIFVPELKQVVYGFESWWGIIKTPDDLKKITDQDIDNVWYVQALRALTKEE